MSDTGTSGTGRSWRTVDGVRTAWFGAPSLTAGAALADRVLDLAPGSLVDLRATGVRVRVATGAEAEAVSSAAAGLGLTADPSALQQLGIVLESADPDAVRPFWQTVLGYVPDDAGGLADPLRRDPALRIRPSDAPRTARNRAHVDVVRPAASVAGTGLGDGSGPYGLCHADPDGTEVDLVPGDPLGEEPRTADWQAVFAAMACYRVPSPAQQRDLATAAARLADDAGFPLLVDLRPGLVLLDSGKDRWDADAHGLDLDFADLAADLQQAARDAGATADPTLARLVQFFVDAADVAAVRAFWRATLGYVEDRRAATTDLVDPRGLGPVVLFQELDATDTARREQRDRLHVELAVPPDTAREHLATALAAGGRLLDESPGRLRVADPEGNELVVVSDG